MLRSKVALVTGASRGIGAGIARRLGKEGAKVAVNYCSSPDRAEQVAEAIRREGGTAMIVQADATDEAQVRAMVDAVEAELGPIDILVNNASIGFPFVPFLEYPWEAFESKIVGEMKASFFSCKELGTRMTARGKGAIVNISSELSRAAAPGFVAHCSAKSALDAFSKALAVELGPAGVRVNVVGPGFTKTDGTKDMPAEMVAGIEAHTPLQRVGEAEDVAAAVLFLASDSARHVTGTYLPVCGGSFMP